jgi:hypothetical protein
MTTLVKHLALISESKRVSLSDVAIVAAALQKQATRDLAPIWEVSATVDAFSRLEDMPLDYWPMIVKDDIGYDGAAGIHLDRNGQPYALITASDQIDGWSLTASHETLEMLVDPFGDRLVAGDSPKPDQGRVNFLVEVSDPSEAATFGYSINGVLASDFYTPHYFDPLVAEGVRYSFTGAIAEPRDVLPGGYLSWHDPESDTWWQEIWFDGDHSVFRSLGRLSRENGSFRSQIDKLTGKFTHDAMLPGRAVAGRAGLVSAVNFRSTASRAAALRSEIERVCAEFRTSKPEATAASAVEPKRRRPGGRR